MRWPVLLMVLIAACGSRDSKPVEALAPGPDVSQFVLSSLQGTRDGDRLDVHVIYSAGAGRLIVELHFAVGPNTHLQSGSWAGLDDAGTVRERSVTFLGGQSGPPSIGGRFDLITSAGTPRYRVTIPLEPLRHPL